MSKLLQFPLYRFLGQIYYLAALLHKHHIIQQLSVTCLLMPQAYCKQSVSSEADWSGQTAAFISDSQSHGYVCWTGSETTYRQCQEKRGAFVRHIWCIFC